MFKLTIAFETLATLTTFVNKMGDEVIGGTISHDQPIASDKPEVVSAPAKKKGGSRAKATVEATPSAPVNPPFPAGPTSFAPGNNFAQPATQPMAQPTIAQPQSQPSVATMAPPQAPVMPTIAPAQASPERQQWNDACLGLIKSLESQGTAKGFDQPRMAQILTAAFTEAGCVGKGISALSDAQIQVLYPILHKHIATALA